MIFLLINLIKILPQDRFQRLKIKTFYFASISKFCGVKEGKPDPGRNPGGASGKRVSRTAQYEIWFCARSERHLTALQMFS